MDATSAVSEGGAIVPAIGTASSTAAIRSLGRRGVQTVALASDRTAPGVSSRYCGKAATAPDPVLDPEGYGDAMLELARRSDVDTVLPFCEADIYLLARDRSIYAEHVGTPWPTLETLRNVQDRVRLFEAATAADVAAPPTRLLSEWDAPDRNVIVKPRFTMHAPEYAEEFGRTVVQTGSTEYVGSGEDVDASAFTEAFGHEPLVQEYVPTTDEYGFFALYDHGEAVATFQHRQRRGWKYAGGPSAFRESVDIPELEAAGLRLLDELEYHGVAMVEFLRDPETGEFLLMEVNPRFWSSLPFTVQAGVDFPALYWRQATGRPIEANPEYDVGVAGHLIRGELLHLHSIVAEEYPLVERPSFWRRALEVGVSLIRHPRFDYLSTDDPAPFVQDLVNSFTDLEEAETVDGGETVEESAGRSSDVRTAVETFLTGR